MSAVMPISVKASGNPDKALLTKNQLNSFRAREKRARNGAARTATDKTRSTFKYIRPTVQSRRGRRSTGGRLPKIAKWEADATGSGVSFNVKQMDKAAPHWLINEIGTGSSGQLKTPKAPARGSGRGRPSKIRDSATGTRRVKSQKGRKIPKGIVFADKGGVYAPPVPGSRLHNTSLASKVTGLPAGYNTSGNYQMIITREIRAKRFVHAGSVAGFADYEKRVLAAANTAFPTRPKRP